MRELVGLLLLAIVSAIMVLSWTDHWFLIVATAFIVATLWTGVRWYKRRLRRNQTVLSYDIKSSAYAIIQEQETRRSWDRALNEPAKPLLAESHLPDFLEAGVRRAPLSNSPMYKKWAEEEKRAWKLSQPPTLLQRLMFWRKR